MTNHGANPVRALVLNSNPTIAAGTKLDITNNVVVVRNGVASGIQSQVAATYAAGAWTGVSNAELTRIRVAAREYHESDRIGDDQIREVLRRVLRRWPPASA